MSTVMLIDNFYSTLSNRTGCNIAHLYNTIQGKIVLTINAQSLKVFQKHRSNFT